MFKTIDRYILREIILPFVIGLALLTFVLEIPVILRQGEDLVAKGVDWPTILRLLLLLLPSQLSLTIPMSLLLGILIGFGRLSSDREFVALQACGVSLWRLLRPLLFVSALATALSAYEIIVALPESNQSYRTIAFGVAASRVERSVRPGVFFTDFPNLALRVRELPPTGGWDGVFLANTSQPGRTTVYLARQGRIRLDRAQQIVLLELIDGTSHTTYRDKPDAYDEERFESFVLSLDPATVFPAPPAKGATEMTFAELRQNIASAAEHGDPGYNYRFMLQHKFAIPVACPILALIGLALGASNRKDGKLASFVFGFAVVFAYYILLYSSRALALGGRFSPELAPWIPDIVMAAAGAILFAWRSRAADQPIRIPVPAFFSQAIDISGGKSATDPSPAQDRRLSWPRTLDVYIARQYWRVIWLGIISLLGIFYISTFIDVADELAREEVTLKNILLYFYYQTPQFIFYVTPIAVLVATLVTVAVMTKNSELIVMRACGISLYRAVAPVVLFGLLMSALLFAAQEWILPSANVEADRLNRLVRGFGPPITPFNHRWMVGRNGLIYRYDEFDSRLSRFRSLWTYDVSNGGRRLDSATFAGSAVFGAPSPTDPRFGVWKAQGGWDRQFSESPKDGTLKVTYHAFAERDLTIEAPDYFASLPTETLQMSYDQMLTFNQLRAYIDQLKSSGANVIRFTVALHRKVAFPLVTVIMTLLAIPFATTGGRRGALYGVGVGIVLASGYLVTMSIFGALGSGGVLPPMLAAWAPNLLFGTVAAYMILTVRT